MGVETGNPSPKTAESYITEAGTYEEGIARQCKAGKNDRWYVSTCFDFCLLPTWQRHDYKASRMCGKDG